ncbi:hypothetical protein PV728_14875 [Streptomyces europaeiscabiei]|uniref:hypothetical protein n=1 Tax=Streptomyces europaeiscabiei TaxID=146819 RepID=UPI0029AAC569|nr:hypothetical protein [Streptomyces europaeiscabiei]MDX3631544.1 hypothetical protein [Streptomyces europaeiscabiei]MDX3649325.1 hypothetical protein [Streptomyces europaeiscabiei]
MPRGRHRHSPPLHRLLPPTAIAGVSLVCALGPWVFSEPSVLRVTAAVAAATAAVGAAVMRRWDVEAGKRVADLTRARASDEWRHEEKAAELETDLDESRELRTKLEHKLRAKRTELANLRNEHAALLRRYATAETERASALEGRRLLEIEAIAPEEAPELSAAGAGEDASEGDEATTAVQASPVPPQGVPAAGAPWASWETASKAAAKAAKSAQAPKGRAVAASAEAGADAAAESGVDDGADAEADADGDGSGAKKSGPAVFSSSGSALFLRANSALDRIITQRGSVQGPGGAEAGAESETEAGVGTGVEAGAEAQAGIGAASEGAAGAGADVVVETGIETEIEAVAEDGAAAEAAAAVEDEAVSEADGGSVTAGESEAGSETETVSATAPGFTSEPEPEPEPEAGAEADTRGDAAEAGVGAEADAAADAGVDSEGPGTEEGNASEVRGESADHAVADSADVQTEESVDATVDESAPAEPAKGQAPKEGSPKGPSPKGDPDGPTDGGTRQGRSAQAVEEPVPVLTSEEDGAAGKSVAVRGHERAAASPVPAVSAPALSTGVGELTRVEPTGRVGHGQQAEPAAPPVLPALPPAGHFTVPTAVAVVPAAPQRRAAVEGGFDFFGTQNGADALEVVQNEDLADVVGQEALALHKAESEARFKLADEATRGVGQVIDLTAHDETEQIDVQGLRTAAS